jgi:plasmid stability protein
MLLDRVSFGRFVRAVMHGRSFEIEAGNVLEFIGRFAK